MGELELDFERFEYERIETFGGDSYYVKVGCRHRDPIRVTTVRQELVAYLCPDCDQQLPVIQE